MLKSLPLIFLLFVISCTGLYTQETQNSSSECFQQDPALASVENGELAFSMRNYPHCKNDSVFFLSRFNEGSILMLCLFSVKGFLIDKWGIYATVTDGRGSSFWTTHEMYGPDVRLDPSRLFVSDGTNTIEGSGMLYHIQCDFDGFSCDLIYENILPPWKKGSGIEYLSQDQQVFRKRVIFCPWAAVTGSIIINGDMVSVKGQGFAEKCLAVNPLTSLDPILYSLRLYSSEDTEPSERWSIDLLESESHPDYGSRRLSRLALAHGNKWVFASCAYTIKPSEYAKIEDIPYDYPRKLKISCEDNGYRLKGEYRSDSLFNYTDTMNEVPELLRAILLLFVQRPVYFRTTGVFSGTLTYPDGKSEQLILHGANEYAVLR